MEQSNKRFGAKQIAITAMLLAVCLVSQLFKNLSVFITGPIINACIVLTVLLVNLPCAILLSVITPITAFIITASPIMKAVPAIIPFIMLGNIVLAVAVHSLMKKDMEKETKKLPGVKCWIMGLISSLLKGFFMGITISLWLLPTFVPEQSPLRGKMSVFQTTFSLYQFLTACIGFVYVFVMWQILKKHANTVS